MPLSRSVVALMSVLIVGLGPSPAQAEDEIGHSEPTVLPVIPDITHQTLPRTALFGGDVRITDASVEYWHKGQLASVADTVGGIYVGVNEVFQDTLSRLVVYRSTDGGENWTQLGGFRFVGLILQSFDMCIADSSGGNWVLGFAMTPRMDAGTIGLAEQHGGSLMYGSMLSDGSHWRVKTIAAMTSSTCYREPSICTNSAGAYVSGTRFYVAAVKVSRADNQGWKLYVNNSTNWGDAWTNADTSITGTGIEYPSIGIDWSANPDSLCIAFSSFEYPTTGYSGRDVCVARNTAEYTDAWIKRVIGAPTDDMYPAMAIDHSNGDIVVSFCRHDTETGSNDLLYYYSTNQFRAYAKDSIATSTADERLMALTAYVSGSDHCWRGAYFCESGPDTLYTKAMTNRLTSFHTGSRVIVNQYRPDLMIPPCIGAYRQDGTTIGLYCVYVGRGGHDVYFDASGLRLNTVSDMEIPNSCALMQNYPNPFNPTTSIGYSVGVDSRQPLVAANVRLAVYDVLGREVAVLVDEQRQPGEYTATWDARGMASGIYVYTLETNGFRDTKKLVLLR